MGVDVVQAHRLPIRLQLVGDDACQRGADMLAHLGLGDVDGDEAVMIDAIPEGRLEVLAGDGFGGIEKPKAGTGKRQGEARARGADQEATA